MVVLLHSLSMDRLVEQENEQLVDWHDQEVQLGQKWNLSFGAQLPSPGSDNPYGGIIQVNN